MKNTHNSSAVSRRTFIKSASLLAATGALPGISWANSVGAGQNRLVLIILRGAMDGLSAVIPYGDAKLAEYRNSLIPAQSSLLQLNNYFALHPAFSGLYQLHQLGELGVVHAVATPYRERSHFDGQNILESGLDIAQKNPSGWLNRAVQYESTQNAMALGQSVPLVLRGEASIGSWAPPVLAPINDDSLNRLMSLYNSDTFLGPRLQEALNARDIIAGSMSSTNTTKGFPALVQAAASFLTAPGGPNIVVLENNGWDTHANQGEAQGTLPQKFTEIDNSITELKKGLGAAWQHTTVMVMTEFGRTVRVNGTQGTDHGTAGVTLLAGGALARSSTRPAVMGAWPGLDESSLRDGRDLQATTDLRSLIGEVLQAHMGFSSQTVREAVFPGSQALGFRIF